MSTFLSFLRALPILALVAAAPVAAAQELTPDGTQPGAQPSADPNGPPPMPPPMAPPGQPGSATPPPPPDSTEALLARAEEQDTGVGLKLFYLQPELGVGWATLGGVLPKTGQALPGLGQTDYSRFASGGGPAFGLGAGFQFVTFQAGARLRALSTRHFTLWNLGGELAYQPGSGRLWPRFGVGVGYAWANGWKDETCAGPCGLLDVSGITVGARAGLQYFVSSSIEIGGDLVADALFLKRAAITGNPVYGQEASGTGASLAALIHLGIHLP
jgi:hypothetical protein